MNSAAHGRSLCSQITMNEWSECQTDRRTTYDNNTALCTVHCAVKNGQYLCRYDVMKLFRLLFGPPCTFAFISYVLYCYRFTCYVSSVSWIAVHVWRYRWWVISISCYISAASLMMFVYNLHVPFMYFYVTQLNSAYIRLLSCLHSRLSCAILLK